jgi:ABC-type uncharacterized transport system substrate-binding protein
MLRKPDIVSTLIIALLIAGAAEASAHPHLHFQNVVSVYSDANGLARMREEWTPKYGFGEVLAKRFDTNADGLLDAGELQVLRTQAFDQVSRFYYFTRVRIDGSDCLASRIEDFSASIRDGDLVYSFSVNLGIRADGKPHAIEVRVFDETNYVSFDLCDVLDPEPCAAASYELEIRQDPGIYSMSNPYGAAYFAINAWPAGAGPSSVSRLLGPESGLIPFEESSPMPSTSAENPFLLDQGLFRTPQAVNPFLNKGP